MSEVDVIMGQVVPVIGAAVGAYGAGVLTRVQDVAVDASVSLGQRVLQRIWHRAVQPAPLEGALADLAADAGSADALAALRLQVHKILIQDQELAWELAGMMPPTPSASVTAPRSVAIGGNNTAPITTGDNSPIVELG